MPDLPPSTTIRYFGDYVLLGEIATGGMGVVHRAQQTKLDRPVALKLLRAGVLATATDIARFQTEAKAAASLDHPNIVPIYEVGQHQGLHFFSMKLIDGESLAERIADPSFSISNREAAKLVATAARAVHHAHQRGVLHRDLKPGNILIDEGGQPHVTDFGLAKLLESDHGDTRTGTVLGTPSYISPEQASGQGNDVTCATDTYGLGAILYELLTRQPPFTGTSSAEILRQVIEKEPVRPTRCPVRDLRTAQTGSSETLTGSSQRFAVDRDLETICLKCLEKPPARRYASAEALANDLERWLRSEPIHARPATDWERFCKWVRRHPATAALSGAVIVSLGVGLATTTWQWNRAEAGWSSVREANIRLLLQRAEEQFSHDESSAALATLAHALREHSGHRIIEERLVNALRWRWFLVPMTDTGQHPFDLSINPQADARVVRLGPIVADASSATNIVIVGTPFTDGRFTLASPRPGIIRQVAISPTTQTLAAVVAAVGVYAWDLRSGNLAGRMIDRAAVTAVDFDVAGRALVAGTEDGAIRLWDLNSSQTEPLASLAAHRVPINAIRFAPDSRTIVSGGEDGLVCVWNPSRQPPAIVSRRCDRAVDNLYVNAAGAVAIRLRGNEVRRFTLSHFASSNAVLDSDLALVDRSMPSLQPMKMVLGLAATNFHAGAITFTNLSADGVRLVTASADGAARVWDTRSRLPLTAPISHSAPVNHARFSPDGLRIATSTADQKVRVWDAKTGAPLSDSMEARDAIHSVRFSDDGRAVIASNGEQRPVHLAESGAPIWLPRLAEALAGQKINANGVAESVPHQEAAEFCRHLAANPSVNSRWSWLTNLLAAP